MRVFVAGANGAVGRRLVPMLVARGHQVTGTTTSERVGGAIRATGRGAGRRRRARRRRDRRGRGSSGAGCDHPRDDGPLGHARLPPLRSLVRADEPASDGGHRAPPRGGQGERRPALRRPELHGLEQRRGGLVDQDRGRPARSAPGQGSRRETLAAIRYPRARRPRGAARGDRRPLRRALRPGLVRDARRRSCASGCSRSSAAARASCPRPTSMTRPAARSPPWSGASAVSTTSSTTSRRRPASSSRRSPRRSARRSRCHIPAWLGRLLAGDVAVTMMTEGRGSSNAKAKRELGWQPIWPSWRDGFRRGLDTPVPLPRARRPAAAGRRSDRRVTPTRCQGRCRRGLCRPSPAAVLDRVSDARRASARPRTSSRRRSSATSGRSPMARAVESPKAYLSAVVTRLAIDHLKSARVRRETYVGEWLPEPLVTDEGAGDPADTCRTGRLALDVVPRSCSSG